MNIRSTKAFAVTALACLIAVTAAGPASATGGSTSVASSTTSSTTIPACAARVANPTSAEGSKALAKCKMTTTLELSQPAPVTAAQVKADSTLSATDKADLLNAVAAAAVTGKHYSQFTTGGEYTTTQNGTFYYNGSKVWVGTTYLGKTGSHQCFLNYIVGATYSANQCTESGATTYRNMYSSWTISISAIQYGYSMTAKLNANGTGSGFGVTTG